ncbi:bifunctional aldolase/short-chain dehydrogenase [Catenulispora sp. NL8]|uniref:Bifunctional aldolase/short-chain dehydrogenase n=1 Tax=Catenulispora pinistramenti TaxID=2705254 RepID=A0ABS5KNL3_9ACTN|nr:bifunctional aldolase/short-chain dehydrogenase [Catenulispora pinistramenti]MBS2547616.1 bifunctional aldolase/short-chain dehydrogenase [Catenulispora pinistramenti]
MRNRWDEVREAPADGDRLDQCVHVSRLLGADPDLVLHGGGNTSVKTMRQDALGNDVATLLVKGSGWDLATIERPGFAPLRLERLREILGAESLSDSAMMNELRCALLDARAPDPSVETLLHALIPETFVLHTHADAVLTLTNLDDGEARIRAALGDDLIVIPYVMPGFDLAKHCRDLLGGVTGPMPQTMVLMCHGVFTYGESARAAYGRMIEIVGRAEQYIAEHTNAARPTAQTNAARPTAQTEAAPDIRGTAPDALELASLRQAVSRVAGAPMIATRAADPASTAFCRRPDLATVSQRGPATPDHVIRTKRLPMVGRDVGAYAKEYVAYYESQESGVSQESDSANAPMTMLDPAPRIALDPELGVIAFGRRPKDAAIAADVYGHTIGVIEHAEQLGGYRALSPEDIFAVEYWELEQAKLRRAGSPPEFAGEVALVTGAASGIGKACVEALLGRGAAVVGLDVDAGVTTTASGPDYLGVVADVTDPAAVQDAIARAVDRFGGIDMLIASAGVFGASRPISDFDPRQWRSTLSVNTDAFADLLAQLHGLLKLAPRYGRVVLIGSKNAAAPGPGAAAYSASKAAATQLARVAALEWASDGIRVNIVHPDAVFDTGLWTPDVVEARAAHYGMTVEQYKQRNLLHTEVTSEIVGTLVADVCGPSFRATTGAQIPVDGGSDRII